MAALKARIAQLENHTLELEALVKYYEERLRLSRHKQFGASSEKSGQDANQLSFFNEAEVLADANVPEPELIEIEKHYRKRTRLTTDKLPDDLPVEVVEHDLPEDEKFCPECGGNLHVMGRDSRRELVIVPARVIVREHVRMVYACRDCEKDEFGVPIVKTPLAEPVIKGSFASPEAIAQIMTQKFVMGSPLYRQEQELQRSGIKLSRQTMSNWLLRATEDWLEPIYGAMKEILVDREVLHADETTLQVLHEPDKAAQSKSYMWLYRTSGDTDAPAVLFDYQPDRKTKRPMAFLKGFQGYLHTDGYEAYHSLGSGIMVVGCWAHARRKFDEALNAMEEKERAGSHAFRGKQYCDRLFMLEREFADMGPQERHRKRQELSKPVVEEFFQWASSIDVLPKCATGQARHYALSQKKYLERYLMDGRLEISNNRAERSIKPFVIGRKNFLFANTPRGARASAVMYSIIETAKENGLDPYKYLVHVFEEAPNRDIRNNIDALGALLPWSAPERLKAVKEASPPA
ncbi:MAG: IS66 family transposase [Christensenellales bacterium]